jgi:single-strand DNA-binding protein
MSTLRNHVQLIGHLGSDPEIKTLESGTRLARIRIATSDHYKSASGEWKEETMWHTVTAWGSLAERAEKVLHKGSFVALNGKVTYREYTDTQGRKRYLTEIKASSLMILEKRNSEQAPIAELHGVENEADDGLPF